MSAFDQKVQQLHYIVKIFFYYLGVLKEKKESNMNLCETTNK